MSRKRKKKNELFGAPNIQQLYDKVEELGSSILDRVETAINKIARKYG